MAAVRSLGHDRATVPRIWPVEISNALVLAVRRRRIAELDVYRIHRTLHRLPLDVDQEVADAALG